MFGLVLNQSRKLYYQRSRYLKTNLYGSVVFNIKRGIALIAISCKGADFAFRIGNDIAQATALCFVR